MVRTSFVGAARVGLATALATALAALLAMAIAAPAFAEAGEPQLTPSERAAGERKIRAAERYLAQADGVLSPAWCPAGTAAGSMAVQATCAPVKSGFLSVEARDQAFGHYCGPAVGQVISNYAWAVAAGANKYTQAKIAVWMRTDVMGQTTVADLAAGLDVATANAPRTPANWDWVSIELRDRNGNGTTGDELHGYVRSNVSGSRMPLGLSVKPHDPQGQFHLSSWSKPVLSSGHWIAAYGWYAAAYDGSDFARIYYTDSSRDEGGSTGKFWDPTRHMAGMINVHTRRLVW